MKRKRRTPRQGVRKLQEAQAALAAGRELAGVCQMLGISEQTYYRWKKKYGGMKAEEAGRLAELEAENSRLKKSVAEVSLDRPLRDTFVVPLRLCGAIGDSVGDAAGPVRQERSGSSLPVRGSSSGSFRHRRPGTWRRTSRRQCSLRRPR